MRNTFFGRKQVSQAQAENNQEVQVQIDPSTKNRQSKIYGSIQTIEKK